MVRKEIILSPEKLKEYVGTYQLAPEIKFEVSVQNGHLFITPPGQKMVELFAEREDHFFLKVADVQFHFENSQNGTINKMILIQNGASQSAAKIK